MEMSKAISFLLSLLMLFFAFLIDVIDNEDMRLLASEINKAGSYLKKASCFKFCL